MSNDDRIRDGFLQSTQGKSKAERPPPEEQDNLGNPKIKPGAGKKQLGVWLDPATIRQFNALAGELGVQKQKLMVEALNLLFERHHKPKIAG